MTLEAGVGMIPADETTSHITIRLDHHVQMMSYSAGLFLCDAVLIQSSGLFSQSRCFM